DTQVINPAVTDPTDTGAALLNLKPGRLDLRPGHGANVSKDRAWNAEPFSGEGDFRAIVPQLPVRQLNHANPEHYGEAGCRYRQNKKTTEPKILPVGEKLGEVSPEERRQLRNHQTIKPDCVGWHAVNDLAR